MSVAVDWLGIKAEYVSTSITMQKLSEKHGVSVSAIKRRSTAENWTANRTTTEPEVYRKTVRKVIEKTATNEANRIVKLLAIGDKLAERLDLAVEQLDRMTVKNRRKTRVIEYGDLDARGKPTREVIDEVEEINVVDATIDRQGLQQLSMTLKNLRDVLQPDKADAPGGNSVAVVFEGELKEAAE